MQNKRTGQINRRTMLTVAGLGSLGGLLGGT